MKGILNIILTLSLVSAISMPMLAQDVAETSQPVTEAVADDDDDEGGHHRLALEGALTSADTWQAALSYHYMFLKFVGIGASVGYWRQCSEEYSPSGDGWLLDDDDRIVEQLYLRPSLLIATPALIRKRDNFGIGLSAEPGLMMMIPYERVTIDILRPDMPVVGSYSHTSNHGHGRWWALDCKLAAWIRADNMELAAGWYFSDISVYSQRRHMSYHGVNFADFYPHRHGLGGVFISLVGYL